MNVRRAGPRAGAVRWWSLAFATVSFGVSPALAGSVAVLNGPAEAVADSGTGELLRIVSANAGAARVTVRTQPAFTLACDSAATVTCLAWVTRGQKVRVALRRGAGSREDAPRPDQWRADCAGTTEPDCTVRMDRGRTVMIDWH